MSARIVMREPSGTDGINPVGELGNRGLHQDGRHEKHEAHEHDEDTLDDPVVPLIKSPDAAAAMTKTQGLRETPLKLSRPREAPSRFPVSYAALPSVIATATRPRERNRTTGSEKLSRIASLNPFRVTSPTRAAISCKTAVAMTEKTTAQRSCGSVARARA